jgi:hypothetical protein
MFSYVEMKTPTLLTLLAGIAILPIHAQDDSSSPGDSQGGGQRPPPPKPSRLVLVLDADHDKVISAAEIAGATAALAALDKNADGQLTKEEFCPPKPRDSKNSKARDEGNDKPSAHRPPPPDPLVKALDVDRDKVISAAELAAAPTELLALDKNGDGQLTKDEFAPPPPKRQHHGPDQSDDDQSGNGQQGGDDQNSGGAGGQQGIQDNGNHGRPPGGR